MKITDFKQGDIITRVGPTNNILDRSYMCERIEFISSTDNFIEIKIEYTPRTIKILDNEFFDDNWDYYSTKNGCGGNKNYSVNIKWQAYIQLSKAIKDERETGISQFSKIRALHEIAEGK